MAQIEWFDVAPAIAFAFVAGMVGRFIGGKARWAVLMGVAYIIGAGLVAAAAVAFLGFDSAPGFVGSVAVWGVLIVPLLLYFQAVERTPVSEAEIDETVAQGEAIAAALSRGESFSLRDVSDATCWFDGEFENLLSRLAPDAPRRAEIVAARDRLGDAIDEAERVVLTQREKP